MTKEATLSDILEQLKAMQVAGERLAYRPEEAARLLGVSLSKMHEIYRQEMAYVKAGKGTVLIPRAELERWLSEKAG